MEFSTDFQTPPLICDYMADMGYIYFKGSNILEPTPGIGNLVAACEVKFNVTTPAYDFWDFHAMALDQKKRFDGVIMNPPFSPVVEGYKYLEACMQLSDNIIALLPWLILINSEKRMTNLVDFGMVSVTHLPRKVFPKSRIQCCIVHLEKGYELVTTFHHFKF